MRRGYAGFGGMVKRTACENETQSGQFARQFDVDHGYMYDTRNIA